MPNMSTRGLLCILLFFLLSTGYVNARTEKILIGKDIPNRFFIGSRIIFFQSDSLFLNHQLLKRRKDYTFDTRRGVFDLSKLNTSLQDTLLIIYSEIPSWVKLEYGRSLPEITPTTTENLTIPFSQDKIVNVSSQSNITFSGAKTFRFTARSLGASDFNQSLDLKLSGNLTPGLEISGAVSDRGFNPSYGTANSRINELDKINLKLSSRTFTAQIGDIILHKNTRLGAPRAKKISGAWIDLNKKSWHIDAVAARPEGNYETAKFFGIDGRQGPYQIGEGSRSLPIVPGSEAIWLDGKKLERGANEDYTIEYPTGRVTFNVNHPIDKRSRIEVDYEPLTTSYRGEYFTSGGSVAILDSSLTIDVRWLREGDDRNQLLIGEFSEDDENILRAVGDSTSLAVRSGVLEDSLGSYVLITDSLPDSVYQYASEKMGDYSITFSFFGEGVGDYVFLGGGQYQYVGDANGDYRPLVIIPAPKRTDYYLTHVKYRNELLGEIKAELYQSRYDKNLLSAVNDDDNNSMYYSFVSKKEWYSNEQKNQFSYMFRKKEANFQTRWRLYRADFNRDFLVPTSFRAASDETIHEIKTSTTLIKLLTIAPFYSRLNYKDSFTSNTGGFNVILKPDEKVKVTTGWRTIRADYDSLSSGRNGKGDVITAGLSYSIKPSLKVTADYEHDSRENDYTGTVRGTRYHQMQSSIDFNSEQINYEYYVEDSLSVDWQRLLVRNRLSAVSSRKIGHLNYNATVTYQWLEQSGLTEENFLSRLNFQYNNFQKKLNFGSSYALSDENRNSRGINYIEVKSGEGNFIFEGGNYIPDADGNFIRVEEILSEQSHIRRGEKSFHFNKAWSNVLIRLNSRVEEELLAQGKRNIWWIIPFLSDNKQPYLFYNRRYDTDIRLFPLANGHAVNFKFNEDREIRNITGIAHKRKDSKGELALKQVIANSFFEQRLELFKNDRDNYFTGGGIIEGYKISLIFRHLISSNELSAKTSFRNARSSSSEISDNYSVTVGSRIQVVKKGELRLSLELYRQSLKNSTNSPSYLLTDNRPGTKGAIWSVALRYGLKNGMRINFILSGRHADNRIARVTGTGEFVAGF